MDPLKPQNPTPSTGSDDDLVYKTMPKGFPKPDLDDMKPLGKKPTEPGLSDIGIAPSPVPMPSSIPQAPVQTAAPGIPGMPESVAHGLPPLADQMPIPSAASIPPMPPTPPQDIQSASMPEEVDHSARQAILKRIVLIASAVIIVILLAGGGYYFWQSKKNQAQNNTPQAAPAVEQTPVSQIDQTWMQKYFGAVQCSAQNQNVCGDASDPDHDGLTNYQEFTLNTDPNNPDSDSDGLADGDEVNIFNLDPLQSHTGKVEAYTDADDAKTLWNTAQHRKFTNDEIAAVGAKAVQYGFHQPSIGTLGQTVMAVYLDAGNSAAANPANPSPSPTPSDTSAAPGALDRDTQRSDVITKLSFALLQYKTANGAFPNTADFGIMVQMVKPLLAGVAINTTDPKNVAPYVYTYAVASAGKDFKLSYFSETQNQAITVTAALAQKAYDLDQKNKRDAQREADLQQLSQALELYSNDNVGSDTPDAKKFPKQNEWKVALAPKYIGTIPVDPQTNTDYSYTVSVDQSSFAIQATLENPPTGKKGYLCTQDDCGMY